MASAAQAQEAMLAVRNPRTGRTDFDLAISSKAQVAEKAARLRANQPAWETLGVEGRCGVMARWLGAVNARAADIGEADAVDTGGCHTSYLQGFITMGNIAGWLEDAPKAGVDAGHTPEEQQQRWLQNCTHARRTPHKKASIPSALVKQVRILQLTLAVILIAGYSR